MLAACQASLEPLRALCRRTVGERLRAHVSPGHPLHPVIAYRAGRPYSGLHILLLDQFPLSRRLAPYAGEAIRLQFQTDGESIRLRWVPLLQRRELYPEMPSCFCTWCPISWAST